MRCKVLLRDYQPEDFDELWRLDQQCFPAGIAYSQAELESYLSLAGAFCLVAVVHGGDAEERITGFVIARQQRRSLKITSLGAGHVITIDVGVPARRAGVGTALMDAVETRLREQNCGVVYLESEVGNRAALSFYERRGYRVIGTLPRYYDQRLDGVRMEKRLEAGESNGSRG